MGILNVTYYFIIVLVITFVNSAAIFGNEHFSWTPNTGNNATVAVLLETEISIAGIALEAGDEIGVFTPDGMCVGGMVWCGQKNHAIAVWGDNRMTLEVDGMRDGERMHFRVWKKSSGTEYEIPGAIFQNGIDTYHNNGIYILLALITVSAPVKPEGLLPEDGVEIAGYVADFSWTSVSDADWYHFQLAETQNFDEFVSDVNYLTDNTYSIDMLEESSTYYWRVRASNSAGSSEWSSVRSFTTQKELVYPPTVPTLISPTNNATGVTVTPVLIWSSIESAESYHLQIASDSEFLQSIDNYPDVPVNQFHADLEHGTVYYWRVRAKNDGGSSEWSNIRSFTTIANGDVILIQLERGWNMISSYVQPSNPDIVSIFGSINDPMLFVKNRQGMVYWPSEGINEIVTWQTTEGYHVYVSQSHSLYIQGEPVISENMPISLLTGWNQPAFLHPFPVPVKTVFESIENSVELVKTHDGQIYWPQFEINDIEVMEPGRSYQVYMRGNASLIYPEGYGSSKPITAYSSVTVNATNNRPVVYKTQMTRTGESAVAMIIAPYAHDGDEIGIWDSENNLVGAGLVSNKRAAVTIWGNNSRTENIKDGAVEGEQLRFTWFSGNALEEKRVAVHSVNIISGESTGEKKFRYTANGISVIDTYISQVSDELPVRYTLAQNYPNPFNPRTIISYALPADEHVRITVYSTCGQMISTLVDEYQPAGMYEIAFDAANLASGMYIYHLQAGFYSDTRKMMLIR